MAKAPTTPRGFKRKQRLTMPLFSLQHTPHLFVRVMGEIIDTPMKDFAKSESGTVPLLPVVNLETGELGHLICLTILQSALSRCGDYLGRCFEIEAGVKRPGKAYRDVEVYEIDDPDGPHPFVSARQPADEDAADPGNEPLVTTDPDDPIQRALDKRAGIEPRGRAGKG